VALISAFSDNEGIIFVTTDEYQMGNDKNTFIQFHRLYHQNWLYLGRYVLKSRVNGNILSTFRSMFLLHGRFVLYEDVEECVRRLNQFICFETQPRAPRLYLLDHKTDSFKIQKSNIDYFSYDFFTIET